MNALTEKATADKRRRGSKRHRAAISLQSQYTQYQPPDLIANLRPYQLDAVKFAIDREVSPEYVTDHLYGMECIPCLSGSSEIYYCKFNGALVCISKSDVDKMPKYALNGVSSRMKWGLEKHLRPSV